ncbi:hypothetical protein ACTXT7_013653 [Hymenolepis weldensis]
MPKPSCNYGGRGPTTTGANEGDRHFDYDDVRRLWSETGGLQIGNSQLADQKNNHPSQPITEIPHNPTYGLID